MDFFREADFETIVKYSGQDVDQAKFAELKDIYAKLNHLCAMLKEKGYEIEIRQDPRKQAGKGVFKFQEYQWARVFPAGMKGYCADIFSYIVGLSDSLHFHMMGLKEYQKTPESLAASKSSWTDIDIENINYEDVVNQFVEFDKKNRNLFIKTGAALGISECITINNNLQMEDQLSLLKNKKQIILQGPPGTGKTRLAKELAKKLCSIERLDGSYIQQIKEVLTPNLTLKTLEGKDFTIDEVTEGSFKLKIGNNTPYTVTLDQIIKVDSDTDQAASGRSYAKGMAKYVKDMIIQNSTKLIQFHPAYSYEDFVRGISVKTDGGHPVYYSENKILGKWAKLAQENFIKSQMPPEELSRETWVSNKMDRFIEEIGERLNVEGAVQLTENINLVSMDDEAFRYKGETWARESRINFRDFIILAIYNLERRNNIDIPYNISTHGFHRKTYYTSLLNLFYQSAGTYTLIQSIQEPLKNFVLIIDEINRANLPSVLGELIYALEYRGESVDSIYEIDGERKITLPPNLFIIGTMNTADRSVGHIDYAIRRRFAFVDVLPSMVPVKEHAKELFKAVSSLFVKNFDSIDWANPALQRSDYLASDFRPEDVWLGHSYFITNDIDKGGDEQLKIKLEYEIRPLLKEYIKDGVLNESANLVIAELKS